MARRRRRVRSVGAVVVNPRHRRKRRKSPKRKRVSAKRRAAAKKGWRTRKRRKNPKRRRTRRRTGWTKAKRRAAGRKAARTRKRRRNVKPTGYAKPRRRPPRRRPSRKRRSYRRRRNPNGMIANLQKTLRPIPLIGGPLATMAGFLPFGIAGALGVEIPIQASAWIKQVGGQWLPQAVITNESTYFAVVGTAVALLAHQLWPGSAQQKKEASIAMASGAYGAAYFLWRQKQMANAIGIATPEQQLAPPGEEFEGLGALVLSSKGYGALAVGQSPYGMGPAYTVGPQGFGAVVVGA